MNTIKISKSNTKLIAHRGASALETENTVAAFLAAANRSYFGIETDVHRTKDGKYVVIHDDTTKRVSGIDFCVEDTDFETLRALTLYDTDCKTKRKDLFIPTLEEYIEICKKYEKTAVLELKNLFKSDDISKIVKIIEDLKYLENVIFISFYFENLKIVRSLKKNQKIQFLTSEFNHEILEQLTKYNCDLDIRYTSVTKDIVKRIHKNNLKINCWTCDKESKAKKLIKMDVDFITTNCLE